jgi:lipopolysaccharide transport system permease protein
MVYYGIYPSLGGLAFLPLLILLVLLTALGVALWLAALSVTFRDIQQAMPFLVQLWLFATPVVYPSTIVPDAWLPVLALNPMSGIIEGFRWALLGVGDPPGLMLAVSTSVSLLVIAGGIAYFRRAERSFADVV